MSFSDYFFNPPADIAAMRERSHERDLAAFGLMGAVTSIVRAAQYTGISQEFRLQQLANALAHAEARMAEAEAKYEAAMEAFRASLAAEALADPENDVRDLGEVA
jgi:hypothetical protein